MTIEYKGFKIQSLHGGDFDALNNVFIGRAVLEDGRSCECHFNDETISYLALADHACRLCAHFNQCTHMVIAKPGTSQGRPWDGVQGTPSEYLEAATADKDGIVQNCAFFIHTDYCNW
jgi:hypothetical protein